MLLVQQHPKDQGMRGKSHLYSSHANAVGEAQIDSCRLKAAMNVLFFWNKPHGAVCRSFASLRLVLYPFMTLHTRMLALGAVLASLLGQYLVLTNHCRMR